MRTATTPFGGSFLIDAVPSGATFTPEELTDEHRAIASMVEEFWIGEVAPNLDAILAREPHLARSIVRRSAELGLTSMQVPETFGGLALDLPSVMVAIEGLARDASYLGWHLGHSGIGMLPLLLYGTDAQKAKYLPRLVSVDLLAAYALTEPQAGSDAMALRTRADLSADGRYYVLNGQKIWITNGGEADLFTVFAKVDGTAITAFLVERAFGVVSGADEHKMGLSGTSTTALYLDNVQVPVENVLGEIGRGHIIALNVLNVGRLELGPNMQAGAREILAASLQHASARHAFGAPLASFGAIGHMLADAVVRMFAAESATWRGVGLVEADAAHRQATGHTRQAAEVAAFEEFAAECSIVKVVSSEMLDRVADHGVQVHGGAGYHRDSFVERAYRDARVNRIFEGTNEINRLVIPGLVARRASRAGRAGETWRPDEIPHVPAPAATPEAIVTNIRVLARWLFAAVRAHAGDDLREPQELVMGLADLLIELFTAEAVWRRAEAMAGTARGRLAEGIAQVHLRDALDRVSATAGTMVPALFETAASARTAQRVVCALAAAEPYDRIAARREIAAAAIGAGRYPFGRS